MKKILAIGSHFDDVEIGCSGTLLKYVEKGDEVYIAITHADEYRTGNVDNRAIEQNEAAKKLGVDQKNIFAFLMEMTDEEIIGLLDELNPDIVFAPFENDTHQHHRRTSIIAQAIARKRTTTTLFYDSGSTYEFHPNVFSIIDIHKKGEVLGCFKSQVEHGAINLDIVERKNAYWACLVSDVEDEYAEGFVVRKLKWQI
jgi:LmbE family N-acetylglucosaminyl deacetylase